MKFDFSFGHFRDSDFVVQFHALHWSADVQNVLTRIEESTTPTTQYSEILKSVS